ncbi:MAG: integration host factor subunit alpha [Polyangiaceae bacterium]|nr:integration host factor subunit alpha [Polyangiaceae bacterium]
MKKVDIVKAVHARVGGFSKGEAAALVELVFETIAETLGRGERVKLTGFGQFSLRDKRARRGRNPRTGEALTIEPRRVLVWKASAALKAGVKDGERDGA